MKTRYRLRQRDYCSQLAGPCVNNLISVDAVGAVPSGKRARRLVGLLWVQVLNRIAGCEPLPRSRLEGNLPGDLHDSWAVLLSWADGAETSPASSCGIERRAVIWRVIGSPKLRGIECIEGIHAKNEIYALPNRRALLE